MTLFLVGLFLSALTGGIIIPQIYSFLLILETDDFDSLNSDNSYDSLEQELLTRKALLVRGARSHHLSGASQFCKNTSSGKRKAPLFPKRAFRPALQIYKNGMLPTDLSQ